MSTYVTIDGSDAQQKAVIDFMRMRKIPFKQAKSEDKIEEVVTEELRKRNMSAGVIVVYQSREMEKAAVAYSVCDDMDAQAVVESWLDGIALFSRDKL